MPRLRRWFLSDADALVSVISWWPYWGRHGIEWPHMRIDRRGQRMSVSPVWDRTRLTAPWRQNAEQ